MAKMNWSWNEKASLKDAVKKFREKHGNVPLDWKSLTAKAQLTRFTSKQVRQKYLNLKKKEKGKKKLRDGGNLNSAKIVTTTSTNSQLNTFTQEEYTAIRRVKPATVVSTEFMMFLGYGKESNPAKTPKLYFDRLDAAIKSGNFDADWITELYDKRTKIADVSVGVKRDMAKLKSNGSSLVIQECPDVEISKQTGCRGGRSDIGRTNEMPEKRQPLKDCNIQPLVLSKAQNKPALARGTKNRSFPSKNSTKAVQHPASEKQNSVYNEVIHGPYGVVLPTPIGLGSYHVLRKLTDNEWRNLILEMRRSRFHICSNEDLWKKISDRAGINSSLSGSAIQTEFCKNAIPRFQSLMSGLEDYSNPAEFDQRITQNCRLTDILIFHSMKGLQWSEVMLTVRRLIEMKVMSADEISLNEWCETFIGTVLRESKDYFSCSEDQLMKLRGSVIKSTIEMFTCP